jgi:hypothetical protein
MIQPTKNSQILSKNHTKPTINPHKNSQENQKVISICKNIKINVDIVMKKGGIQEYTHCVCC